MVVVVVVMIMVVIIQDVDPYGDHFLEVTTTDSLKAILRRMDKVEVSSRYRL